MKFQVSLLGVIVLSWPLAAPVPAAAQPASCTDQGWVGAWEAPPSDASLGTDTGDSINLDRFDLSQNPKSMLRNETVRAILTPTLGGSTTRVRLSNRFGTTPVTFTRTTLGHRVSAAALTPDAASLTFDGKQSVTAAPGQDVVSDPVPFTFNAFEPIAVSVYIAGDIRPTEHYAARQTSYLTPENAGDHTADSDGAAFTQHTTARPFVDGIEVQAPKSTGAVVTLGDSITDGYQGTPGGMPEAAESIDADGRWPDNLARRLRAAARPLAVLNAGIAGNRVLQDATAGGSPDVYGPAAIHRLDADVLSQAGVTTVVLLEGINDLIMAPNATVDELVAGYRQLIDRMHSRGLRVLQGTMTPIGGMDGATPDDEARRQAVNTWIRAQSPADGVVDFDAAVRDPADPTRINPAYDGSDHLHFNLVGYRVMADAVPLDRLIDGVCS
ncbi:SGNH/GDSL hydrolase family protein [Mycolicibacterium sp. CBMA 226]|uniref:SGNH/GDSL hydrolase family protein n=1 Tax=Mycolicibacterium sp. CBMA 226 TaxID=2606611 RepID=UPI0012DDEB5F|nr:SGNH/GDSL hydrolase family protein [Mycolicibacterium sp. CBMA 226]MUL75207.1 SGNH/GDSL hydrolase family protein [Mycolicibacterium sp. CBMA 226]